MELTPDFSISINGSSTFPKERVLLIRTTDQAGIVSDSCEFELDDFDGALRFPNTEAKVIIFLGYKETGLTKIGTYFVKEISIDGARHIVHIQCNAASKIMRSQKTKTNEGTIEDKIQEMGTEFDFDSEISGTTIQGATVVLKNDGAVVDTQTVGSDGTFLHAGFLVQG